MSERDRSSTTPPDATTRNAQRRVLAALLLAPPAQWPSLSADGFDALCARAEEDGIASLLGHRLHEVASPPDWRAFAERLVPIAAKAVAATLLRDRELERVSQRLADAGLDVLVLKGAALARWLYPRPSLRESGDIDLLLRSRADAERCIALLAPSGFIAAAPPPDLHHEWSCTRPLGGRAGLDLDLHWKLANAPVFAERFDFDRLRQRSRTLPGIDDRCRALCPVDAALHAAVHRAMNRYNGIDDTLRWLLDLHLLAERFAEADWQDLLAQARAGGLCGTVLSAFDAAADLCGTRMPDAVRAALADAADGESLDHRRLGDWAYMQRQHWRALPDLRTRLRWLRQKLLPTQAQLRKLHGDDAGTGTLLWRRLHQGLRNLLLRR